MLSHYFKTRKAHLSECWEHAQHHWAIAVPVGVLLAYSLVSEYGELVDLPQLHLKKLPLPWALVIVFAALFFIVLEGSIRLHHLKHKQEMASAPLIHVDIGVSDINEVALILKLISGRIAHRIDVKIPEINGFKIRFDIVAAILEGTRIELYPSSLNYHGSEFTHEDGKTLGGFLRAMESTMRRKGGFSKDVKCKIPMTISYQDNNQEFFEQDYSIECGMPLVKDSKIIKEGALRKRVHAAS